MTPGQIVFIYEEREREIAERRLSYIADTQAVVGGVMSQEGGKAATAHAKALQKFIGQD